MPESACVNLHRLRRNLPTPGTCLSLSQCTYVSYGLARLRSAQQIKLVHTLWSLNRSWLATCRLANPEQHDKTDSMPPSSHFARGLTTRAWELVKAARATVGYCQTHQCNRAGRNQTCRPKIGVHCTLEHRANHRLTRAVAKINSLNTDLRDQLGELKSP